MHRAADMDKFDVHFRRMIRCMVGAPGRICWHDPWYEILHIWNQRVREMVEVCHIKMWAETCASQQWKSVAVNALPLVWTPMWNTICNRQCEILAHMPREAAAPSRTPAPSSGAWLGFGHPSPVVAWRLTSKTVVSLPGD